MADNVIQLPRPAALRPSVVRLGHYLHIDWNDHLEVLQLVAEGERGYLGFVIGAQNTERHKELIKEGFKRGFDLILDPKTQQSALPGSYSHAHSRLPWGLDRPHRLEDFDAEGCVSVAGDIAAFAVGNGFTQVLSATHALTSLDDPWLAVDLRMYRLLRERLPRSVQLIYPLSLPIAVLRDTQAVERAVLGLRGLDLDAIWLRIENFGADASGDKTLVYINAAMAFHALGVPVISDFAAGLVGQALIAFGAVGGIAHGVMMHEGFTVSSWRRPPSQENARSGGLAPRVYVPQIDMLLSRERAALLVEHSVRTKGHFGCQDPKCCPKGTKDTIAHPARHYIKQRGKEIEALAGVPATLRTSAFVEQVRRASDLVAAAAGLSLPDAALTKALIKKQKHAAGLRMALSNLAENHKPPADVVLPKARDDR